MVLSGAEPGLHEQHPVGRQPRRDHHGAAEHRRHAAVEQSIAELKSAGLAHLPSGRFMPNAAWLALAVTAHNLGRAVGALAGMHRVTAATLRRRLFTIPGRLVHTARRLHLRRPANWPWADAFLAALGSVKRPPDAQLSSGTLSINDPVGFQNSATGVDLRLQAARSYSLISPPSTGRRMTRWRWRSRAG
jgi:hypothetical protein